MILPRFLTQERTLLSPKDVGVTVSFLLLVFLLAFVIETLVLAAYVTYFAAQ